MLTALNFSLIRFLKFKYYGTFTNNTPIFHPNAHLNTLKGIFSDKPLIIAEINNCQFAEILNFIQTVTVECFELFPKIINSFCKCPNSFYKSCLQQMIMYFSVNMENWIFEYANKSVRRKDLLDKFKTKTF